MSGLSFLSFLSAIAALLLLAGLPARAVPTTIFPDQCYSNFDLLQWDVKRYGPVRTETRPPAHSPACSFVRAPSPSLLLVPSLARLPVHDLQGRDGPVSMEGYAWCLPNPIHCLSEQFHGR